MMVEKRKGAYWHIYPTFAQARKAIWEGFTADGNRILDLVFPREIVKSRNETEMKIELRNGTIWRLIGSDKIEVVGAGPVGVVFSEYAMANPLAWNLIAPMLMENSGWAAFITTPRGHNHAYELYQLAKQNPADWFCELQTLRDTKAYDPEKTIASERASGRPEALIRQEYLCDWSAANVGSVWGDLLEALENRGGVADFEHERDGVYTSWDLGHTDATAIWFWRLNEHRLPDIIDHYEAIGKPMSHYFQAVDSKGYTYVKHWLPHDAKAKTLQTGSSIVEQALAHWGYQVEIAPRLSLSDGIQAGRWLLQQPIRFHSRCETGLKALKHYHYDYDEETKAFSMRPDHDWSSHSADSFRYMSVVVQHSEKMSRPTPKEREKTLDYQKPLLGQITMNEWWNMLEMSRE